MLRPDPRCRTGDSVTAENQRELARLNRLIGYAVKFAVDAPGLEPVDVAIARTLADCARPPRPDEYPEIRVLVRLWRDGQVSVAAGVRETLLARAETYADDWHTSGSIVAGELRKAADGIPA